MIKITNGKDIIGVTKGAFNNIYKQQGFRIYEPKIAPEVTDKPVNDISNNDETPVDESNPSDAMNEDETFIECIIEKPISKWTSKELTRYAEVNKIDLADEKKTEEIRAIVKEYLK